MVPAYEYYLCIIQGWLIVNYMKFLIRVVIMLCYLFMQCNIDVYMHVDN